MQALILGCGYLGSRLARDWLARGDDVAAVTRSPERAARLRANGITSHVADITQPATLEALPSADLLFYAVAYDRHSSVSRRGVVVEGLANVLTALSGKVRRVVFISSSSVYGVSDGGWVDETTPLEPSTEAGRVAAEAEELVMASRFDVAVLRMSGLYGPGRLLRRIEQLKENGPLAGNEQAWLNLIHIEDAARAGLLAADRLLGHRADLGEAKERFLVSDDEPLRRRDYYEMLARAAEAPQPRFDPERSARRIVGLGKRCRNERVKRELGLALRYPRVTTERLAEMLGESGA